MITVIDLAAFLLARIAEDEAAARTASLGPWRITIDKQWHSRPYVTDAKDRSVLDGAAEFAADQWLDATDQDLAHIVRWHPARVLAECAAKRLLIEQAEEVSGMDQQIESEWGTRGSVPWDEDQGVGILRHLALPYADHPDYREEWKP